VLYVLEGELSVPGGGTASSVPHDGAWYGSGPCEPTAGPDGATVLRWELVETRSGRATEGTPGPGSTLLLEHPIELDPGEQYLMRCDRVDFDPGSIALPHRHRGGGIRCLIAGALELRVGAGPPRMIRPGQAWFESGREPVWAAASSEGETSFIRVAILPRAIRGRSSIMYVDPEDAKRGRPRKYTVFVDEPIELEPRTP
jgi:quercetin dioxygenase-like cupin family protein